jgi:hypothetical protein
VPWRPPGNGSNGDKQFQENAKLVSVGNCVK